MEATRPILARKGMMNLIVSLALSPTQLVRKDTKIMIGNTEDFGRNKKHKSTGKIIEVAGDKSCFETYSEV